MRGIFIVYLSVIKRLRINGLTPQSQRKSLIPVKCGVLTPDGMCHIGVMAVHVFVRQAIAGYRQRRASGAANNPFQPIGRFFGQVLEKIIGLFVIESL
ncbi:hypothetical protein SDC9_173650 [bioreactor metagenome]|uniref:Uncharacterized protein n=1 Tax=bioreactor metagenome TaxID=1076179 RepID=A0A645GJ11_9ZZZZ